MLIMKFLFTYAGSLKFFRKKHNPITVICNVWLLSRENVFNELTPWSRVLLDKLIITQLVKKFAFYGAQRFITMLTRACH
jgi:hypothetical protein